MATWMTLVVAAIAGWSLVVVAWLALLPYTEWSVLRGGLALVVGLAMSSLVQDAAAGTRWWHALAMAVCGLTAAWYARRWCRVLNRAIERQVQHDLAAHQPLRPRRPAGRQVKVGQATSGLGRRLVKPRNP